LSDPSTYWLTLTNIGLGLVVLICCAAVAAGVVQELAAKHRRKLALDALDREVLDLVESADAHAFDIPGLGLTMADGGEPTGKKTPER
jgi:hypothetical protein